MNSSGKLTVRKLHIVITIIILIEVIILLGVFTVYILKGNTTDDITITSKNNNEITTADNTSVNSITESQVNSENETLTQSTFEYTIDGITFDIPEVYKAQNNAFQSEYSTIYFISKKIDGFWAIYMLASDKDIDGYADSAVSSYMSVAKRESSTNSSVAGCKSRQYKYYGNINGEEYILSAEIIVSPSNDGAIGIIFLTPEKNSELKDFESIIESGKTAL